MTTKNCANGPKLVLKDLCKKSFVRNDRLPFLYLLGYRGRGGEGRGGEWEWWVGEEQRFFKAFCIDHKFCFLF